MSQNVAFIAATAQAPARKTAGASSSADASGSVNKRLGSELMTLMMASEPGITAFPKSDADLHNWVGRIEGPADTVYVGMTFKIALHFPSNYPMAPPKITFTSPCYHPNVDLNSGSICLDILQDKWSAVYSVHTILLSLQSLLGEPNNASPLNTEAAGLWDKPEEFKAELNRTYQPVVDSD